MSARRRPLAIALGILVVGAVCVGVALRRSTIDAADVSAAATTAQAPAVWFLPAGDSRLFDLNYRAEEQRQGVVPGEVVGGSLHLQGRISLTRQADAIDGTDTITMRFVSVAEASMQVLSAGIVTDGDRQWLLTHPVSFVVDDSGRLQSVLGIETASLGLTSMLRSLGQDLQIVAARDEAPWTRTTTTTRGTGPVVGQRTADGVILQRDHYDTHPPALPGQAPPAEWLVDGTVDVGIDDDGILASIVGDEVVTSLDDRGEIVDLWRSTLTLAARRSTDPLPTAVATAAPTASTTTPSPEAQAAERLALLRTLDSQLISGFAADGHRGFRQLVDAIVADDSLVDEVVARFVRGGRSRPGAIDLLVAAGTPAAQAALVRVLAQPPVDGDLLQRLAHLPRAELVTIALLREHAFAVVDGGQASLATPARLALGALAGLGQRDARPDVQRAAGRALDELRAVVDGDDVAPAARAIAIRAIGNAGKDAGLDDDDLDRVTALARDDDQRVRAAVAAALRRSDAEVARDALVLLAGDADDVVQASALAAMAAHLDDTGIAAIGTLASEGRIDRENAGRVVAVLRTRLDQPQARAALQALIADNRTDSFTEGMARDLLDGTAP